MVFYSMSAILPQMSLYVFTTNGIEIGVISIPNGLGALVGGWVLPTFSHKIRHFKIQIVVALVIETLFVALYAVAVPSHKAAWMAFQFLAKAVSPGSPSSVMSPQVCTSLKKTSALPLASLGHSAVVVEASITPYSVQFLTASLADNSARALLQLRWQMASQHPSLVNSFLP
jgi:hypothetical protein